MLQRKYTQALRPCRSALLVLFLAACDPEPRQNRIEPDEAPGIATPSEPSEYAREQLPGEIVGQAPLFEHGTLRKVRTCDLMPREVLSDLGPHW